MRNNMYSSRGGNAYGQQSYTGQSAYGQNLGAAYSGNSVGGPDAGSQLPMVSRHSSMLGGSEEVDASAYRGLPSAAAHYGGQYSSLYGSAALSSAPQVAPMSTKGSGPSVLESRGGYTSAKPDSPKFSSGDYISSSSHGYGHKGDQLYGEKAADYPAIDRRQFGEHQSAYMGRDLQGEPTSRYADSVGFGPQHQSEIYDRIDKAVLLRQEQLLKSQSLQSASLDGSARQADYLAARGAASRHPTQDLTSFGARMDANPRSLSMLSGSSYGGQGQPAPSILGAAPRRNVDDLMFSQSSSNPGYGVSLPPGRDYVTGKGLRGPSLESDYPSSLSHGGHPRIDEHKDDRASYLQEFELREEARRRERLHERERDRDREKEWERERERERDRERERERERERILERRMKERERERKRALETRRERTPPRVSKDRRGSSLAKEGRPLRRDSPHHEASHRRHSPVKDKRREYACKVYSTSLMDAERDYLSIDKRYPRLFVSSEFCKAVVKWPRENLQLSIHTPVSFEHDFVEEESTADLKEPAAEMLGEEPEKLRLGNIVWNVKIILMSGLSKNALEELSSERGSDDRIAHICNILRFAVLKKDRSYMAIGGPWNPADGGDPSVDDSSLIQTALRYGKDVAKLDLQNCKHWNRFLEIHYDRIGKDGLFSHREVTVIFVPDLSECLPSLDSWRDQWLAHKKAVAERERQLSLKKEKSREKEGLKDKEMESSKHKRVDKEEKKNESTSTGDAKEVKKLEQDGTNLKGNTSEGKGDMSNKKLEKKNENEGDKGRIEDKKEQVETAEVQATRTVKTGKKKIIKKVVRQKVVGKLTSDSTTKQTENLGDGGTKVSSEDPGQEGESSAEPSVVKTFVRKKVIKKVPVEKAAQSEDNIGAKVKVEKEAGCSEDKSDPSGGINTSVKTIIKKKIIKRVPKRKLTGAELNEGVAKSKKDGDGDEKNVVGDETESTKKQTADAEKPASEGVETGKKVIAKPKASKTQGSDKQNDVAKSSKADAKDVKDEKKDEKGAGEKSSSVTKVETELDMQKTPHKDNHNGTRKKLKDAEKTKDEKEKKDREGKDESRGKSNKELKDARKPEEPPRHPGLILQTKWSKDSKLRSSSLSLDLLLDYTDKDIEESTFELSLFAETLYEMLQYQMGSRLLTFLQKLRIKFVTKRNQRKRQREVQKVEKGNDEKSPSKRPKMNELPVKNEPSKSSETLTASKPDGDKEDEEKTVPKENSSVDHVNEVKMEHITDDEEEDPEEDPEECEEMVDASPQHHSNENNENNEEGSSIVNPVPGNEKAEINAKEQTDVKAAETKAKLETDTGEKKEKVDTAKKETPRAKDVIVDKELLQAFRFFDRNQVGYVRVEDMRLIIHNLGKFLSHRDVKELVQSALLESNTGRDDRILYKKLVRMTDI